MDFKYNGIILGKKDVGETDRIYTIFTLEAGKIKALGKGVRRSNAKLAGHLEPVTAVELFVAKSKGMGKLTGAIVTENFNGIKTDLESLREVAYVFDVLDKVAGEQANDPHAFNLVAEYIKVLEGISGRKEKSKKRILTLGFLFKLFGVIGYHLEAFKCISCGAKLKPENNHLSYSAGGILCGICQKKVGMKNPIESETIKLLRIFSKNKIENLTKLAAGDKDLRKLAEIADNFIHWIVK